MVPALAALLYLGFLGAMGTAPHCAFAGRHESCDVADDKGSGGNMLLQLNAKNENLRTQDVGTPPPPTRELTPADWEAAVGKFFQIPARREGVQETLFAKAGAPPHKCGSPCVAHCISGQPREMTHMKGLWKSIKHRLFEQFSEEPIVFALLALGATTTSLSDTAAEGTAGYVRTPTMAVKDEDMRASLEYLGVDRAVLVREACTTGECLAKGLKLKCKASELGITALVDKKTGIYSNMCELQVSRFRDALELVREYEAEHNMKFDWVTRPRPDVYFTRPVTPAFSLDQNSVHVSPWAQCGYGGMDWFYALPRKHAQTVADFSQGASCSDYKGKPEIQANCNNCPGCECWMAAWMIAKNVSFTKLPWQWFTPKKFCGEPDCPHDWDVTHESIMGLDSRVANEPCKKSTTSNASNDSSMWCPMLLSTSTHWQIDDAQD